MITAATADTDNIDPGMRGHSPVTERTWDSTVLDRRIKLDKVPLLTDDDLHNLRLELQEVSSSLRDQLELNTESTTDWIHRAKGKQRIVYLFVVACGAEANRRQLATNLECARQKTIRAAQDRDQNRRRAAKRARVVHDLLVQEWGQERTDAFYDRADELAGALLEQAAQAEDHPAEGAQPVADPTTTRSAAEAA
jgi:hypothetical protein